MANLLRVLISLVLLIGATSLQAKVVVFSAGSNVSLDRRAAPLQYAADDAVDFGQAMSTVGGTESTDVITLKNPSVGEFIDGLERASERVKQISTSKLSKFVFFYSGHADERGFHFRDGYFSKNALNAYLEKLLVKTKVVILDSCFAGIMANKGVKATPGFGMPKMDYDEPTGSIYLTAASSQDLAFESRKMKGGLFSRNLIAGLYGSADSNHDGVVTATELYEYAFRETQLASYFLPAPSVQKPEFVAELRGRGAVALSFPNNAQGQIRLTSDLGGSILLASAQGISSFSDTKARGLEQTITLPVGKYKLHVVDGTNSGETEISVGNRRLAIVTADDIAWSSTVASYIAKSPTPTSYNSFKYGLETMMTPENDLGLRASFLSETTNHWQFPVVGLRAQSTSHVDRDVEGNHLLDSYTLTVSAKIPLAVSDDARTKWRLVPGFGLSRGRVVIVSEDCPRSYLTPKFCYTQSVNYFGLATLGTEVSFYNDKFVMGLSAENWMPLAGEGLCDREFMTQLSIGTFM